jgi:hypothetical protein
MTMRPTEDFSVFVKNVDRSKSKNLLKNYEKFFKVSETMFKAIDHATFKASAREIITNIDDYISRWGRCGELIDKGYELIEESPFRCHDIHDRRAEHKLLPSLTKRAKYKLGWT